MSTNKTPPGPSQGSRHPNQDSVDFIESLPGCNVWGKNALRIAASGHWGGDYYSEAAVKALDPALRHHVSAGIYRLDLKTTDQKGGLLSVPFIVIDDVGVIGPGGIAHVHSPFAKIDIEAFDGPFATMPETSWRMETSKGNCQFGYHFNPPIPVAKAHRLHAILKARSDIGRGLHSLGQYARLPSGTNSKPGRDDFKTRLVSKGPSYTLDEFLLAVGIDPAALDEPPAPKLPSGETCSMETLGLILDAIPNDNRFAGRSEWVGVAHAIANTVGDEGRDLWLAWSDGYTGAIKQGEAERVWDTLPVDHSNDLGTLRKWLINVHGETSPVFVDIQRRIANDQAPLGVIEGEEGMPETKPETAKAEKELKEINDLIEAIAKTQEPFTPARHRHSKAGNGLDGGKLHGLLAALSSTPLTNAPMVVRPYARGMLSAEAGPPGVGKSLLLLHQMLGVVFEEPKLVRGGTVPLDHCGDVVYVSNEDSLGIVAKRAKAIVQHFVSPGQKPVHELYPVQSLLLTRDGDSVRYDCIQMLKAILAHCETGRDLAVLWLDTLPSSIGNVEENSTKEMSFVMNLLARMARRWWCAVIFTHHGTKAAWIADERNLATGLRGAGAIGGAVRGVGLVNLPGKETAKTYGWNGRNDIIEEFIAKDPDGLNGVVAGYYEKMLETIQVEHSKTGATVDADMPVLVWLKPVPVTQGTGPLDPACRAAMVLIREAEAQGREMRRPNKTGRPVSHSAVDVLAGMGLPDKTLKEIIETLISDGQLEVIQGSDGKHEVFRLRVRTMGENVSETDESSPF